ADITDGTSSTVLFNEVRCGLNANDQRGVWAMGVGGASVTVGHGTGDCLSPNDSSELSDDIEDCSQIPWYSGIGTTDHMGCSKDNASKNWPNWQAEARSRHTGGVNVCFADGGVRFIADSVSTGVWYYMN